MTTQPCNNLLFQERRTPPKIAILCVASGRGTRLNPSCPKQYLPLSHTDDRGGWTVLDHTLQALISACPEAPIQVVIHPEDAAYYESTARRFSDYLLPPVYGGETRQESVRNGLKALEDLSPELVLIHDAARPFVRPELVHQVIDALSDYPGVTPGIPVVDTLKKVGDDGQIESSVSRDGLWRVQTPQGFHFQTILDLHDQYALTPGFTDDASLLEAACIPVRVVSGCEENVKITTPQDYKNGLKAMNKWREKQSDQAVFDRPGMNIRVGQGVDVHATKPGDGVWLLGVWVPAPFSLLGHSDADVGLHSLCDALFGALADGDIGVHFPPSDPQWKGADSKQFLTYAVEKVRAQGGAISHVDVTIVGERPKVLPHRPAMRLCLEELLGIPQNRISVKATTTEKLGFTGREEGLMALATATVVFL